MYYNPLIIITITHYWIEWFMNGYKRYIKVIIKIQKESFYCNEMIPDQITLLK